MKKQHNGLLRQVCSKDDLADIIGVSDEQLIQELAKEGREIMRVYKRVLMPKNAKAGSAGRAVRKSEKAGRKKSPATNRKNKDKN